MDKNNEEASFIPIVFLLLIALASFYYQALVTEERFVPALNVISKRLRISDDVAGATLMAAGASSPELFAALVSVFITHSALGTGTVVGSEVCNFDVLLSLKNNVLIIERVSSQIKLFLTNDRFSISWSLERQQYLIRRTKD
jgi:Ca2+/Na+ antiporter